MNLQNDDIRFYLVVGIAAMMLLFISFLIIFIFSQRKRIQYQNSLQSLKEMQQFQLIDAAVRSEETERHRIAEELHDEVGAILSSTKLHVYGIGTDYMDEYHQVLHKKCTALLDDAIIKVRGISHNLHSSILKEFGLNEAIKHFANKLNSELIEVTTDLDYGYITIDHKEDINVYRIIQELINNTLKHANASKIIIGSQYKNKILTMTISHNGEGLTQAIFEELRYKKDGLGLKNIQNRAILLKSDILFSKTATGYKIDILVPRNETVDD
jgi:two-component system, NarL family, sensor kinase